ncbi:MAG: acylneuraminate cytidylyltransferase family protein [Deltaproteobacteria bacterium]|nr:acylneuraminate cytidylyltransferase family protein [Candidatus Anaeroferrophillacea bacterium]
MEVLLVIPARGGSKGMVRKNLRPVGGRPLISYVIEQARKAVTIDRVIVTTEDEEIAATAREWGAETPFRRPAELAADHVSLIPVIAHAARAMAELGRPPRVVVSAQPTAPLLQAATIDRAVNLLRDTGCDSVVSVRKIDHNHPYRAQRLADDGRLTPLFPEGERYLQRQDLPLFHALSGGLYVRQPNLLANWSGSDFCLGADRRAVVVTERESVNIDTPLDLALFQALMEQFPDGE